MSADMEDIIKEYGGHTAPCPCPWCRASRARTEMEVALNDALVEAETVSVDLFSAREYIATLRAENAKLKEALAQKAK